MSFSTEYAHAIKEDQNIRKILVLVPCDIFPPMHGGGTRARFTIEHLSRKNRLNVLLSHAYSRGGPLDLFHPNLNIRYCPKTIMDKYGYRSLLFNPLYLKESYKLMKESDSDIIHCELLWSAFSGILLKKKFQKPLVLVDHNVEYLKFKQFGKLAYFSFIQTLEKICCEQADKIVVVSEVDRSQIARLYNIPEKKLCVIRNSVDPDVFKYNEESRSFIRRKYGLSSETKVVTFVGKLDYTPNAMAVRYIANIIYPAILEKHNKTKFLIVGENYEQLLKYKRKNMIFIGYVNNLPDYLSASDVVIVPLDRGSGTRLKILEAASCSRPIVSTKKGVEGQDFLNYKEMIITERVDKNFIEGILELMENTKLSENLGRNARKKIESYYTWKEEIKKFEKIYEELESH